MIYKSMLIEKNKIMSLIEKLSKAYNECDGKIAHIETDDFMFLLVGEENTPRCPICGKKTSEGKNGAKICFDCVNRKRFENENNNIHL